MNTILTIHLVAIVSGAYKQKIEILKCSGYFNYDVKICQNLYQRRKVKIYMCSDTVNGKNFLKICVTSHWHKPLHYVNGQFYLGTHIR